MRWKLYWEKEKKRLKKKEIFGINSAKHPKVDKDLIGFESQMIAMVKNIEFRSYNSVNTSFQAKLTKKLKEIKKEKPLYVSADKSNHFYKVNPSDYRKVMKDNITKTYKKVEQNEGKKIDEVTREHADKLQIAD